MVSEDSEDDSQQREDIVEPDGSDDNDFETVSLDDLGEAYARAAAAHDPEAFAQQPPDHESTDEEFVSDDEAQNHSTRLTAEEDQVVTPESIIEAALFIGHPENRSLNEQRLASLMRGVEPSEVVEAIEALNESYREAGQALRIVRDESGYRMTIAPAVEGVRRSFLGKVREARLSQAAIEVLALVAYQPGIASQSVQDQRGRESGAILNQMVRRRLLEMRREKPAEGGRAVPRYYPTERFLTLFGLQSLDELPQVEESLQE